MPFADRNSGSVEHCQQIILDNNAGAHRELKKTTAKFYLDSKQLPSSHFPPPTDTTPLLRSKSSALFALPAPPLPPALSKNPNTIRFQVVIWHIGRLDLVQGRVPITFRVTLFWNAPPASPATSSSTLPALSPSSSHQSFRMLGRQRAFQPQSHELPGATIDIPAVSILNTASFDTIGEAEVSLLREDTRLMRWSCMYRAVLSNSNWSLRDFPHDEHELCLRLAILAKRGPGERWDRNLWKVTLATEDDAQGSVRVPYGMVVDDVSIPEFRFNKAAGLGFEFTPLDHGPGGVRICTCLEVKLNVTRNSAYYDRNIMPLLGMLNVVAATITTLEPHEFFQRALLLMNIAFVEINMRMRADSNLPTASYLIKMQRILNEYFIGLLCIVLESYLVYSMHFHGLPGTAVIDAMTALAVLCHNFYTLFFYYADARRKREAY